jgi:Uma2 family endonuclease
MSVSHRRQPSTALRKAEITALMLPRLSGLRVSDRVFWQLCSDNRVLRLERSARGELIVLPNAGATTGARNAMLTYRLAAWAEADGAGKCFASSAGFTLPNSAIRSPDASWIVHERWKSLSREEQRTFAPICPDFVVELMSPSDGREETREKLREYIEQGARLGWLLDPEACEAEIYRPGQAVETLVRPASLSGENVLPGFVLDLKEILFD